MIIHALTVNIIAMCISWFRDDPHHPLMSCHFDKIITGPSAENLSAQSLRCARRVPGVLGHKLEAVIVKIHCIMVIHSLQFHPRTQDWCASWCFGPANAQPTRWSDLPIPGWDHQGEQHRPGRARQSPSTCDLREGAQISEDILRISEISEWFPDVCWKWVN